MKIRMYVGLAFVLLVAINSPFSTASAQGTAFTYQGLLDDGGAPANGTYDFRFRPFNALTNGSFFGQINLDSVPVSNGLFTVTLAFNSSPFDGSPRWLEIAVAPGGTHAYTNLVPRQAILPTPYAIFANAASNLTGTLPSAQVTGTIPLAQLPASVVTNGASGVNITGTFSGNGAGVSNLNLVLNSSGSIRPPEGDFFVKSTLGVGPTPYFVTAADVNGDSKPDLINVNLGVNTLSVLTNNGSGGFVLASSPAVGATPYCVTAADVNGDGKPDLISANAGAGTLTVLTNKGSGGFAVASSPAVGVFPVWVASGDVNGDGKPDLISANSGASSLTVLTNNGSGGFVLASSPAVGNQPFCVTAAEVNGDGKLDLISANEGVSSLTVLTNNGSGGFVVASTPAVGNQPYCVTAADVNGDGKLDLICANAGASSLTVLTNNGGGGFVVASTPAVGSLPKCVTAADINGDGKPDLISANNTGGDSTLTVLTNNGSGGFVLSSSPVVGSGPISVVAADVNGDGKLDLISANIGANTLSVLFNAIEFDGVFNGAFVGSGQLSAASISSASIGTASFGSSLSQKLNLYSTTFGLGIQNSTLYSRVGAGCYFAWYAGGAHADGPLDAGGGATLMTLTTSGLVVNTTFVSASDRNLKQDFSEVDSRSVLEKVAQLPIHTWVYKNDPGTKHLGPMAQDFYAAFAVGPDDKHITTVDESGIALAAIQGLNEKLEARSQKLEAENLELRNRLERLEKLIVQSHK